MCKIGAFPKRIKNRSIVISALDNLVKGFAGQAIQNMSLMFGLPETAGPERIALFSVGSEPQWGIVFWPTGDSILNGWIVLGSL